MSSGNHINVSFNIQNFIYFPNISTKDQRYVLNSKENSINNWSAISQNPFSFLGKDEILPLENIYSELGSKLKIFFRIEPKLPEPFLESQINS